MKNRLQGLVARHRALDRRIREPGPSPPAARNPGCLRVALKDEIAALEATMERRRA
ncbi:MAG: hypothetical protein ACFBQW_08230 [Sphingomonadaceae bacterium]